MIKNFKVRFETSSFRIFVINSRRNDYLSLIGFSTRYPFLT